MAGALLIRPERGRRERAAFIDLPYRLYRREPLWVPPIRAGEAALMNRRKNPFFQHAEVEHFLAWRGRRAVGRIAAICNRLHNEFHGDRVGFFGFFDLESDPEVAQGLLDAARTWCAERGLAPLRGPTSYSTNDMCGVLVDGFDEPPRLLMPYNRPDYDALITGAGLRKAKDLLALWISPERGPPERFVRVVERRLARGGITLRRLRLDRFAEEIGVLQDLYHRCWERNWGFVPATPEEFAHAARQMKILVVPSISLIAERDGEPVAFSIFLQDLNVALRRGPRNGRLLPFHWIRLLLRLRRVHEARCILLGVVPEARGLALNEALFVHALKVGQAMDYRGAECGWVLEDNELMVRSIVTAGGRVTKRYRLYETS